VNQVTGLLDAGHEVELVSCSPERPTVTHPVVGEYGLLARTMFNVAAVRPKWWSYVKALASTLGGLFRYGGAVWRFWGYSVAHGYVSYPHWNLLRHFLQRRFDVIYCHYGPMGQLALQLRGLGVGGKICTVFHGVDISRHVRDEGRDCYRDLFANTELCLPISEYWEDRLLELGCEAAKVRVHHMGIDPEAFAYCGGSGGESGAVRVLTIGRLVEKKGYEYALRAIAQMPAGRVEYVIVGDGPLREELESLTRHLGAEDRVTFRGALRQDEVRQLYGQSDLFLLASVTAADGDKEGIPVVLMEAQASGLPVVATMHSGIGEVVKDGETGFLVAERDVAALTERLRYLVEHRECWAAMGRRGREVVCEQFNIGTLNRRLGELLRDLVER